MGLKDLFIVSDKPKEEYVPTQNDIVVPEVPEPIIPENVSGIKDEEFVANVYEANNLTDMSSSIFKVEEVASNLPDTLPTDTKRTTVVGILSSFKLSVVDVVDDGLTRINAINECLTSETRSLDYKINQNEEQIEELKKNISYLQGQNFNLNETLYCN